VVNYQRVEWLMKALLRLFDDFGFVSEIIKKLTKMGILVTSGPRSTVNLF
jgi:hypothetical protein